jgi:ligand-binding sensor domain-containing protein
MVLRLIKFYLALAVCCSTGGILDAQPIQVSKMITVSDGLPQSFVSGIDQDKNGFLWIATLNGFGCYDGRGFKQYRHTFDDSSGLSDNIILHLFDAGDDDLLLCYMDGKVDLFNTVTEKVSHLWKGRGFDLLQHESAYFKSLVRNSKGICWMMAKDGGLYRIDLPENTVRHFSFADLKLGEPVIGLAMQNDSLQLFTQSHLHIYERGDSIAYPFKRVKIFKTAITNVYSPGVRPDGDLIFTDEDGMKIWNPGTGYYKQITLHRPGGPGKLIAQFDHAGNYYFEYNAAIYILRPDNSLVAWAPVVANVKGIPTSMYTDRSGVLWVGTNGYGLRQYNLLKTGLQGYENHTSFVIDVLSHCQVSAAQAAGTFLSTSIPFANRSATFEDSVWITDIYKKWGDPQLALFSHNRLSVYTFHNEDASPGNEVFSVRFLGFTSGVLWGIDQRAQLLRFNTGNRSFQVIHAIAGPDPNEDVNGMVPDGDSAFYISTNKSLVLFNIFSGHTENLTTFLPSKDLLHISNDPHDADILWIGTLSDGLMRFEKHSKRTVVFSIATGLPNNTIYCIIPGNDGLLWCSSNKGIFAFNERNQTVRAFTSKDGLTEDEFNRYYYMMIPDGSLAFGGPLGYTIFNPSKLETDAFDPQVMVTDLNVINMSGVGEPLNEIKELHVRYDQNFITAEFAVMQFDFPEKLQYRYMLSGFDKNWIMPGNGNKVSYTSLPPGSYMLLLNGSNTSGKWSSQVRSIKIIISPPFWKTWWFYLGVGLIVVLVIYLFLHFRIRSVEKAHAQKLQFEREAIELHAMALRARMNPHFIFNCLNSIKALIQEKQDKKAISYLTTFVTLIRKQVNNTSNEIALRDELETCRLYLELEAMRFDGRIAYVFDMSDEQLGETRVPPLILQPIVENAVVHGLLPKEGGGLISIKVYSSDGYVVCEMVDNGIGRAAAMAYKQKSSRLHQSKGMQLMEERITVYNRLNERLSSLETVDLCHPDGNPSGTLVIIKFNIDI